MCSMWWLLLASSCELSRFTRIIWRCGCFLVKEFFWILILESTTEAITTQHRILLLYCHCRWLLKSIKNDLQVVSMYQFIIFLFVWDWASTIYSKLVIFVFSNLIKSKLFYLFKWFSVIPRSKRYYFRYFNVKLCAWAGARVRIECKDRNSLQLVYSVEGVTDSTGTYKISIADDHGDQMCDAVLVKSPQPDCAKVDAGRDRSRLSLTRSNGLVSDTRFANAMGFMKDEPASGCTQLLKQYQESDD